MNANTQSVYQIFDSGVSIEVPFFQRSYVWTDVEWKKFLSDMEDLCKHEWNETTIMERADWLAEQANEVWYNDCSEDVASLKNKQDESAFSLDDTNFMNKSRFIPYLVKKYLELNPSLTFAELQEKFPDTLLDSNFRRLGVLVTKEAMDASTRDIKQKQKWYYVKDSPYLLTSGDGVQFYVNNQWTIDKIQPILKMAEADGWTIIKK